MSSEGSRAKRGWRGWAKAAVALSLCLIAPAHAVAPGRAACAVAPAIESIEGRLPRVAERLAAGKPITIVAFGSSSTYGTGASSEAASYPSRLAEDLRQRFPQSPITVINRGVPGEDTTAMIRRLEADVLAAAPDLVIWQAGSNDILEHADLTHFATLLTEGVKRMRAGGADVLLLDPQYSPRLTETSDASAYVERLRAVGRGLGVPVLRRWDIMQAWIAGGAFPIRAMLDHDGLHMTDTGYACLAEVAARQIALAGLRS